MLTLLAGYLTPPIRNVKVIVDFTTRYVKRMTYIHACFPRTLTVNRC